MLCTSPLHITQIKHKSKTFSWCTHLTHTHTHHWAYACTHMTSYTTYALWKSRKHQTCAYITHVDYTYVSCCCCLSRTRTVHVVCVARDICCCWHVRSVSFDGDLLAIDTIRRKCVYCVCVCLCVKLIRKCVKEAKLMHTTHIMLHSALVHFVRRYILTHASQHTCEACVKASHVHEVGANI